MNYEYLKSMLNKALLEATDVVDISEIECNILVFITLILYVVFFRSSVIYTLKKYKNIK